MINIPKSGGLVLNTLFTRNNMQSPDTQTLIAYDLVKRCVNSRNQNKRIPFKSYIRYHHTANQQ